MRTDFFFFFLVTLISYSCSKKLDTIESSIFETPQGCTSFRVFAFDEDRRLGISVFGERDTLQLSKRVKSWDLSDFDKVHPNVVVLEFSRRLGTFSCTSDAYIDGSASHQWDGIEGTVSIWIVDDQVTLENGNTGYSISILLENMVLKHIRKNKQITLDRMEFNEVVVGD